MLRVADTIEEIQKWADQHGFMLSETVIGSLLTEYVLYTEEQTVTDLSFVTVPGSTSVWITDNHEDKFIDLMSDLNADSSMV